MRKLSKSEMRQRGRELRAMLNEWDPIGVSGLGDATDEYDCLLWPLMRMLEENSSVEVLAAYLTTELRSASTSVLIRVFVDPPSSLRVRRTGSRQVGRTPMSKRPGAARHREQSSLERAATPPNKGMKQTSVEHIGRSQLIPGVLRTIGGACATASLTR